MPREGRPLEDVRAAKARAKSVLGHRDDVTGIGITRLGRAYGLKVNLTRRPPDDFPDEIDGVPLVVEVVGDIRKQ